MDDVSYLFFLCSPQTVPGLGWITELEDHICVGHKFIVCIIHFLKSKFPHFQHY